MTKIAGNILELIGNTPLVKLNKLNGSKAEVLLKLESFNPMSSVKKMQKNPAGSKKADSLSNQPVAIRESGSLWRRRSRDTN